MSRVYLERFPSDTLAAGRPGRPGPGSACSSLVSSAAPGHRVRRVSRINRLHRTSNRGTRTSELPLIAHPWTKPESFIDPYSGFHAKGQTDMTPARRHGSKSLLVQKSLNPGPPRQERRRTGGIEPMSATLIEIVCIFLLIGVNGLFAMSELAVLSARHVNGPAGSVGTGRPAPPSNWLRSESLPLHRPGWHHARRHRCGRFGGQQSPRISQTVYRRSPPRPLR